MSWNPTPATGTISLSHWQSVRKAGAGELEIRVTGSIRVDRVT